MLCPLIKLAALIVAVVAVTRAGADEVLVVKTSDAEPYAQAEAAVRDRFKGSGFTVRTVLAKQASEAGVATTVADAKAVVAIGTSAAKWLHKAMPVEGKANVPLVYCMSTGVSEAGLTEGAPAWGVTTDVPAAEQLKVVAEALPRARVVGSLYRSDAPESVAALEALRAAAPKDWRVESVAVNEHASIAAAIDALMHRGVDVVWTAADPKLYDTGAVRALLLASLRSRTPVWGYSPAFVRAGALVGVGVDPRAQGAQAADLAVQVVAAAPAVRPGVFAPREYQVALNLIVAQQLDLTPPDALTRRAAFVYRPEK